MHQRFAEIDIFRGIAIILMVIFHTVYDLNYLGIYTVDVWHGLWLIVARTVQFIFIFTTAITLVIAHQRGRPRYKHALKIFGWGMVITLITWILFKEQAVKFGILHFYAVAMILALPVMRFKMWNVLFGIIVLLLSLSIKNLSVENRWLFPLGITTPQFQSLDYFPLFPWFGLFLIGIAGGFFLYGSKKRVLKINDKIPRIIKVPCEKLGQHSLLIYLIHQPLIFIVIGVVRLLV